MARTGPDPPDMDWARLDLRGINSTRNAWGYLSPNDEAIVDDEGRIYIRADRDMLECLSKKGGFTLKIVGDLSRVLARCLRWAKIVKDVMEFQSEEGDDKVAIPEPSQQKVRNVRLNLERNRKPKIPRISRDFTE